MFSARKASRLRVYIYYLIMIQVRVFTFYGSRYSNIWLNMRVSLTQAVLVSDCDTAVLTANRSIMLISTTE